MLSIYALAETNSISQFLFCMFEHRFKVMNTKIHRGYNMIDLLGPKRALIRPNPNREIPEITLKALNCYDHKTNK